MRWKAAQAQWHYSDLMASYKKLLYYPGKHTPMPDKSETYRVEGMNAELRHYLARLHRRCRCFSRCAEALRQNVKLFVYAWNRRAVVSAAASQVQGFPMQFINP